MSNADEDLTDATSLHICDNLWENISVIFLKPTVKITRQL